MNTCCCHSYGEIKILEIIRRKGPDRGGDVSLKLNGRLNMHSHNSEACLLNGKIAVLVNFAVNFTVKWKKLGD